MFSLCKDHREVDSLESFCNTSCFVGLAPIQATESEDIQTHFCLSLLGRQDWGGKKGNEKEEIKKKNGTQKDVGTEPNAWVTVRRNLVDNVACCLQLKEEEAKRLQDDMKLFCLFCAASSYLF